VKTKSDRRASPRRHKLVRVFVFDPADALDEIYTAWMVDRSAGGVRLSFPRCEIVPGNILKVQPAGGNGNLPWVKVVVKHRRVKASRVELGCEFVQKRGWERILLLD
jgi:hypothetical protein